MTPVTEIGADLLVSCLITALGGALIFFFMFRTENEIDPDADIRAA